MANTQNLNLGLIGDIPVSASTLFQEWRRMVEDISDTNAQKLDESIQALVDNPGSGLYVDPSEDDAIVAFPTWFDHQELAGYVQDLIIINARIVSLLGSVRTALNNNNVAAAASLISDFLDDNDT